MAEYERKAFKFFNRGMQLTRPVNALEEGKYTVLKNVRSYVDGTIHSRKGLGDATIALGAGPVHSIKRFYDSSSNTTAEVVGSGTSLYFNTASVAIGFSGDPLSFVQMSPFSSIENWLYVGDSAKLVKVNRTGGVFQHGLTPPLLPADAALGGPSYLVLEEFESLPNGWVNGGTAGALSLVVGKRVNTTISHILYDSGATGWACVVPAAIDNSIQSGAILTVNAVEDFRVEEVFTAITNTTISSIKYDSGSTGLCTIQLAGPSVEGLKRDALVRIGAAENVRVLSVTTGPDGIPSFRCSTTGTRAVGNAVEGLASFRAYLVNTASVGNSLTSEAFQSSVSTGIGYLEKVASFDLSLVNSRPINHEDEIHVSVRLDVPGNLTEGKVMFNTDASTTFDKNYLYFPFTASALIPATTDTLSTQSVQQNIIQKSQIDQSIQQLGQQQYNQYTGGPTIYNKLYMLDAYDNTQVPLIDDVNIINEPVNSPSGPAETTTGDNQWTELVFKVKDLLRIGPDTSKGLSDVNAIRIQFNVTSATVCAVDAIWIGGTYGLDNETTFPYVYTYRYKSSATGAVSNPAPPMRSGITVTRGRVVLTPTVSSDPQVDQIDYFRYGGTLSEWHYLGTGDNSGSFTDSFADETISGTFGLDFDNFQPFPIADSPRSGTCDVVGTEVTWLSGDTFNTDWARGSQIIIDGTPTSLYTSPSSTTALSLEDNLGTKTGVSFVLPSPTLLGQPVTAIWGPYSVAGLNFLFGCKDGTLYFTKANNPDSAPENYLLSITSPSEPLIGGCIYDGQGYVFSTERMFRIIPVLSDSALFEVQEVPVGKGLMAPWAIAVDELIYFVSRDGLYQTNGSEVKNISDTDMFPFFPHDGQAPAATVGGFSTPDFTQTSNLRMAAGDGLVKFTYKAQDTSLNTLVYDSRIKGFVSIDSYTPNIVCHYWDEGGSSSKTSVATRERAGSVDGKVYTANLTTMDDVTDITSQVTTGGMDMGDSRLYKQFGDILLDIDTALVSMDANAYVNGSFVSGLSPLTTAVREYNTLPIQFGSGHVGRYLSTDYTWTGYGPTLYEWIPSFLIRPDASTLRVTDWMDAGYAGDKRIKGFWIKCDTEAQAKTVSIYSDGGTVAQETFLIPATIDGSGRSLVKTHVFAFTSPFVAKLLRLQHGFDTDEWQVYEWGFDYDRYPENLQLIDDFENDNDLGAKFLQGFELEADTNNTPIQVELQGDDDVVIETFTINHDGRETKGYSLETPYITHNMRLVPQDEWRKFSIKWIYEPCPENVTTWENQGTSHGFEDFHHLRRLWVALQSNSVVTLHLYADGVDEVYSLPSTNGNYQKLMLQLKAKKAKLWKYRFIAPQPFRLFLNDSVVEAQGWGMSGLYKNVRPFGHTHHNGESQARI